MNNHHEWIPSDLILEVAKRASTMANDGPKLLKLQNELRNETFVVVFNEAKGHPEEVKEQNDDGMETTYYVPNGHAGAVYFSDPQPARGQLLGKKTFYEEEFHNALRDAFQTSTTVKDAAQKALAVAREWIWDGSQMTYDIHPRCVDRLRQPLDSSRQGQRFQQIEDLFKRYI